MKRSFHHASLKSPRLQKLIKYLRNCGQTGATTFEITIACQTTRASSDVAELRACQVKLQTLFEGVTDTGRRIYRYILK